MSLEGKERRWDLGWEPDCVTPPQVPFPGEAVQRDRRSQQRGLGACGAKALRASHSYNPGRKAELLRGCL